MQTKKANSPSVQRRIEAYRDRVSDGKTEHWVRLRKYSKESKKLRHCKRFIT
ncbi:hypothetical protein B0O99DRAFT_609170, partial [Bisporella sp. PMI_857]